MARGWGRSLDITTLMVLLRHKMHVDNQSRFTTIFDDARGFAGWWGAKEPDDAKFFETYDSALLALLVGPEDVPGVDE